MAGLLALDWKSLAKRENMDRRETDSRGFLGISAVGAAAVELGLLLAPSHPTRRDTSKYDILEEMYEWRALPDWAKAGLKLISFDEGLEDCVQGNCREEWNASSWFEVASQVGECIFNGT